MNFLIPSARAAAKALLAWYITEAVLRAIKEQNSSLLSIYNGNVALLTPMISFVGISRKHFSFTLFTDVEMPTIVILANMELKGVGINMNSLQELSIAIKSDLSRIEEKAFSLAGRKFNFYSPKEVSQVFPFTMLLATFCFL
jgi:hypothetical protein